MIVGLHNDDQRVSVSIPFEVCIGALVLDLHPQTWHRRKRWPLSLSFVSYNLPPRQLVARSGCFVELQTKVKRRFAKIWLA